MRKLLFRWLCLILVFAACFMAAKAHSGGMDMFMEMFLGPSGGGGGGDVTWQGTATTWQGGIVTWQ